MGNANKSPKSRNNDKSGKVIWNPYPGPDHQQFYKFYRFVGPRFNEIS